MIHHSQFVVWRQALQIIEASLQQFYRAHGYDVRHLWVLMCLREGQPFQGECADRLGINRNVMVKLVDDMESRGLVRRTRNPNNRKEVLLKLPQRGREALEWMDSVFDLGTLEAFAPLNRAEVNAVTEAMKRIVNRV